jgi:hypothetical protein
MSMQISAAPNITLYTKDVTKLFFLHYFSISLGPVLRQADFSDNVVAGL